MNTKITAKLDLAVAGFGNLEKLPIVPEILESIAKEAALMVYEGISEAELDKVVMRAASQHIKDDPIYDRLSARLLLNSLYREVLGLDSGQPEFLDRYRSHFRENLATGVKAGWLSSKLEKFTWEKLIAQADFERDDLFTFAGLETLARRYMMRDKQQRLLELPQYFWLRVAMGLSWNESRPDEIAAQFYDKMSRLEYVPGGSTNVNAGSAKPRLSNCFIMDMEDDIEHIGKTVADVLKLSKATGGIGLSVTKLRASGSPISTNNTFSSGPIPFLHIIDSSIRAISRAGKKMGALCFYMENWHLDFQEYVDLKQNAGDDYRRTRTANIAVYLSDEFMARVQADADWYLFDPADTPDLVELYGEAFGRRYREYCSLAEAGKMRTFKKIKALDQFRQIIVSLQASAHPWLTFKDAINVRALNNNTGTIYGSNLCTEITLPANRGNVAVCNLASVNLARHVDKKQIAWEKLSASVRLAIRSLDNLVDINEPPVPEAVNFDSHNRALGLGVMGLADLFERLEMPYDSAAAAELTDEVMEFISYEAISASADLAAERGAYSQFMGSRWEQGYLPFDTLAMLEKNRGQKLSVSRRTKLDWEKLRLRTQKGMRNSTLLAIAPTANIGLVAGTSTGIDPRFAQIFSRNTLGGKHLELNNNLVARLKALQLWEKARADILSAYGDIGHLDYIPETIREIFKDSFSVRPEAFIEVAARAQKWVDQAISRNMYLATREIATIMNLYLAAWNSGLKTTYYLHMKPRHSAEQSTVKVNKATSLGKRGFGATLVKAVAAEMPSESCPLDPQERLLCESCQ
ncbi:TPA: ribonucleoside-diphosphate reductase subunit alpha [Candidatus Falkowbacteria bacterium]|nr:MAG: ribonucleotide-diphosphate reductase subunit alpha [Candidatus Falkowbacteria bacterium GW2011_GWF2_43_32]HBA36735.1 ribonucleoside-diphosphate reductase subunit alpha [Candidatus Falkowbacteria bacterium]